MVSLASNRSQAPLKSHSNFVKLTSTDTLVSIAFSLKHMSDKPHHAYDAIVVGSGASGGWACKRLAEAGLKVALLEAGRPQSDENFTEHKPAFELKYRNMAPELIRKTRPIQIKFGVCNEYTY